MASAFKPTTPLSPLENVLQAAPAGHLERTPVGDRDNFPKIQLCIELRQKDMVGKKTVSTKGLVLEVAVMYIKNLPRRKLQGKSPLPTFVKLRLTPGDVIYSTELKMDKTGEKVDFIEVFDFPLQMTETMEGKSINVLVCDRKMTRNSTVFGQTEISVGDIKMGKPVCKWYNLK